jgi:hypothetical protein
MSLSRPFLHAMGINTRSFAFIRLCVAYARHPELGT